jgi:hypothetical protein
VQDIFLAESAGSGRYWTGITPDVSGLIEEEKSYFIYML